MRWRSKQNSCVFKKIQFITPGCIKYFKPMLIWDCFLGIISAQLKQCMTCFYTSEIRICLYHLMLKFLKHIKAFPNIFLLFPTQLDGFRLKVRDCHVLENFLVGEDGKEVIPMICTLWIQAIRNKMASDLLDFQKSFLASLKWNISDFRV